MPIRHLGLLLLAATLSACARAPEPAATPTSAPAPATTPAADTAAPVPAVAPEPTGPEFDPAPWSAPKLAADAVPAVYLQQWRKADNRATCAPLAPVALGVDGVAKPRAANFSGGWAVAYDLPGERSAFGVAGAGIEPGPDTYDGWPDAIAWADGSVVHYGPEGGTGPDQLAYLQVAGQRCLYNVWSKHGAAHLVALIEALRLIETTQAPSQAGA